MAFDEEEEEEEEGSLWLPLLTISDSYFFPKSGGGKSGRGEVKNSISWKQYFGRRLRRRGSRFTPCAGSARLK